MKTLLFLAAAWVALPQNPPQLSNAHLETRVSSGDLGSQLRSVAPAWFGYRIKTLRQSESCCWTNGARGCWLEDHDRKNHPDVISGSNEPVELEGRTTANVLLRVVNNQVEKVQMFSSSCALDAGGLPFVWLTGVTPAASLKELQRLASSSAERLTDGAMFVIAQHDAPEADTILNDLAATGQPEKTRGKAAFWLGSSRGAPGVKTLQRMLENDTSERVRDKVVFALSITGQPEGLQLLIKAASTDASSHIRGQAIFWLAQKAGKKAEAAITNTILNDPDTGVKKEAVFALSQLPRDEGVPKLIDVARTQKNPEVRKQAFFWLGQSGDSRALAFIEQVLEE